jgi:GT2 family glycosyltransferase
MTTLAVLMTCHERRAKTLRCLASLERQVGVDATAFDTIVVDAGSRDGTAEAISSHHPTVTVIPREADLFWNGGMRVAMETARRRSPDAYLWLNDDVVLDADAIARLMENADELLDERAKPIIVVGSTRDPQTAKTTYGGVERPFRSRPLRYELVEPDRRRPVETMNGNCVLLSEEAVERIGNLSGRYTHGMGDYDYGHRAWLRGSEVWLVPGTIGTCARNPRSTAPATLAEFRTRAVGVTTGLPVREWTSFAFRWGGPLWPIYAASPYVRRGLRWLRAMNADRTGASRSPEPD